MHRKWRPRAPLAPDLWDDSPTSSMTLLRLQREPSDNGATLGALYINDVWQCWTLEDVIREPKDGIRVDLAAWVASWKVAGRTAIPAGRYALVLTRSQRFGIVLPELVDVPGFSGIRVHAGNRSDDTEGCVLVGEGRQAAAIGQSKLALDALLGRLTRDSKAGERFAIDVVNPPALHITTPPPTSGTAAA